MTRRGLLTAATLVCLLAALVSWALLVATGYGVFAAYGVLAAWAASAYDRLRREIAGEFLP